MNVFLVGGAVRDKLLGLVPKDQDWVIVGASPEDVNQLIQDGYSQVGADFPVFLHPVTGDEYALARTERKVGVGYHGFEVLADEHVSLEDDLARRDLTINSLAMDENGNVIDAFGGLRDLHNHILRHTTIAFSEDPLRVLRLARFAARFPEWSIAPETMDLCQQLCASGELTHLTCERVWLELEKGFAEKSAFRFLQVLSDTGALKGNPILANMFGSVGNPTQPAAPALPELNGAVQVQIAKTLTYAPPSSRMYVAVGLLASRVSSLLGASVRAKECHANFNALREADGTAKSLMMIMKKAKALQQGTQFPDLVMAALVAERGGAHLPFTGTQLATARGIIESVRAEQFPGVTGKELGLKIEEARIARLQDGLNIPTLVCR